MVLGRNECTRITLSTVPWGVRASCRTSSNSLSASSSEIIFIQALMITSVVGRSRRAGDVGLLRSLKTERFEVSHITN
jgi:hypothetical protein